jgi:putative FmdB family regulatory protein
MPTYEYRCNKCGHTFERFQAMTAAPVALCPKCNGSVTRLIGSGSAVIFKSRNLAASTHGRADACSRERPCCGRDTPCEHRPCEM